MKTFLNDSDNLLSVLVFTRLIYLTKNLNTQAARQVRSVVRRLLKERVVIAEKSEETVARAFKKLGSILQKQHKVIVHVYSSLKKHLANIKH